MLLYGLEELLVNHGYLALRAHLKIQSFMRIDVSMVLPLTASNRAQMLLFLKLEVHEPSVALVPLHKHNSADPGHRGLSRQSSYLTGIQKILFWSDNEVSLTVLQLPKTKYDDGRDVDDGYDDYRCQDEKGHGGERETAHESI